MGLSTKQRGFILDESAIKIAHGSIRSSKTTAQIIDWLRWVPTAPAGPLAVVGRTRDTIGRNVLEVIEQLDPRAIRWRPGAPTAVIMGRRHHILGANDAQSETKVRGLTLAGALVDEVTVLPESLFVTLLGRLSVTGARLVGTTNPDNPSHWLKRKYLDRASELGWSVWHFTMRDNPGLSPEYISRMEREYTGLYYRRFIEGAWVAAEGAVFDTWDPDRIVVPWDRMPPMLRYVAVGIDYGTTNATAALLAGQDRLGRYWLVDEFRHDPATGNGRRLTDAALSQRLISWLLSEHHPGATEPVIPAVVADPSAASFRLQLAEDGIHTTPANNEVLTGIQHMASLIAGGRLMVSDRCKGFIAEAPGYSWDPKATEKGRDAPLAVADHSVDAARYALMEDYEPLSTSGITGLD